MFLTRKTVKVEKIPTQIPIGHNLINSVLNLFKETKLLGQVSSNMLKKEIHVETFTWPSYKLSFLTDELRIALISALGKYNIGVIILKVKFIF